MTDAEIRKFLAEEWPKHGGFTPSACQDILDGNDSGIVLGAIAAVRRSIEIDRENFMVRARDD